ncbi:MAG: glycosyltransferase family 2 protein [Pelobacteraceae bacterium]
MACISIIIVNWNGRAYLSACLESLRTQSRTDFETIVVDNGSHDGSLELLRDYFPWVHIVPLEENCGFAGGNNAGLAVAHGDYIITLNNDTRVDQFWLAELVAPAEADRKIGMVASRICSWDNPDQIDSLGVAICPDGMSRGNGRRRSYSSLSLAKTEKILIPSACAALYRREMIDEIGFFDNDFFAYCEDTDLGLRGRLAGWEAVLARDAVVYHRYSGSGGVFSPFKLYLVERNHFWVALKNLPFPMLLAVPFWSVIRYLVQVRLVLGGKGAGAQFRGASSSSLVKAVIRGIFDALIGLPRSMGKRKTVMASSRLSSSQMRRLMKSYSISFMELLDAG